MWYIRKAAQPKQTQLPPTLTWKFNFPVYNTEDLEVPGPHLWKYIKALIIKQCHIFLSDRDALVPD